MTDEQLKQLLQTAVDAALAAAICIRKYFGSQQLGVQQKRDGSPVTLADQEAEAVIRAHLLSKASIGPLDILGEEQGLSRARARAGAGRSTRSTARARSFTAFRSAER